MSARDSWKVLAMLAFAVAVVALYCYARVDLGLTQEQVNQVLHPELSALASGALLIWSQIILAVGAGLAYHVWRHRADGARVENSADSRS